MMNTFKQEMKLWLDYIIVAYRQVSNIKRTYKTPVGAAPTTFSFST